MDLGYALCAALVDGWHGDWKMSRVVAHAWALTDKQPDNETAKYLEAAAALKAKYISAGDRAQVWIARNLPQLNDALWASRPRETCIATAARAVGKRPMGALRCPARAQDKRHDWNTCK